MYKLDELCLDFSAARLPVLLNPLKGVCLGILRLLARGGLFLTLRLVVQMVLRGQSDDFEYL